MAPPIVHDVLRSPGRPLEPKTREFMEARFGHDFSHVRVHTDARAAQSAQAVNANAYTVGRDIVFGGGRFKPKSTDGKRLLAHELAHVVQYPSAGSSNSPLQIASPDHPLEARARSAARSVQQNSPTPVLGNANTALLFRDDRDAVIERLLDENDKEMGESLLVLAVKGEYTTIFSVLDRLGRTSRDNVSLAFVSLAVDQVLRTLAQSPQGSNLLSRLYDEITSGSVSDDEKQQAQRIIKAKTGLIEPSQFEAYYTENKPKLIFPYRKSGITVLDSAPIFARLISGGKVQVKIPMHVFTDGAYPREVGTLPTEVFSSGIELPENQMIRVNLYDEGEREITVPALYLVQLGNETVVNTFETMGTAAGVGISVLGGGVVGGAQATGWMARSVLWADRIASVLGAAATVIREHRGWIIKNFKENGRTFVETFEYAETLIGIYGLGRLGVGLLKLANNLRKRFNDWRSAADKIDGGFFGSNKDKVDEIVTETEPFIKNIEEAANEHQKLTKAKVAQPTTASTRPRRAERPANKRRKPKFSTRESHNPEAESQQLAATGTDGPIIEQMQQVDQTQPGGQVIAGPWQPREGEAVAMASKPPGSLPPEVPPPAKTTPITTEKVPGGSAVQPKTKPSSHKSRVGEKPGRSVEAKPLLEPELAPQRRKPFADDPDFHQSIKEMEDVPGAKQESFAETAGSAADEYNHPTVPEVPPEGDLFELTPIESDRGPNIRERANRRRAGIGLAEDHHIASRYDKKSKEMFKLAGMDIDDELNKIIGFEEHGQLRGWYDWEKGSYKNKWGHHKDYKAWVNRLLWEEAPSDLTSEQAKQRIIKVLKKLGPIIRAHPDVLTHGPKISSILDNLKFEWD